MLILALYIVGMLITASLLMAWFHSSAPIHVFYILKWMGWRSSDISFWAAIPHWETTWEEWSDHINLNLHPCLATLLTCKYCLSFHVAFWVSFILTVCFCTVDFWCMIPLCTLSWPVLSIILVNKSK